MVPEQFSSKEEWENYKKCFNSLKPGDEALDDKGDRWLIRHISSFGIYKELIPIIASRYASYYSSRVCNSVVHINRPEMTKFVKFFKKHNAST